jgi:hypothetical protein
MRIVSSSRVRALAVSSLVVAAALAHAAPAAADAVTDWNTNAVLATKGFNGTTGVGVTLDSNLSTRIEAIAGRAVFDAVNSVRHFNDGHYYYAASNSGVAEAAAAQAAHDVLLAQLPNPATDASADARWSQVRAWLDARLSADLEGLGVSPADGGIVAGKAAAAAANAARNIDNSSPATTYGAQLTPTTNPGIGIWRQTNSAAPFVSPATGAPTGFDADGNVIQGRPGAGLNWGSVTPFSITLAQQIFLVRNVPTSPAVGSHEYRHELEYVKKRGQDSAPPSARSSDLTAQALFYKQDAEIFVFEAARIASSARRLSLEDNAGLFALLGNALADARIAAFASKYELKYWRPITALNAGASGAVTNGYRAWRPLAATPSHPSNTSGHSATAAAGLEVLRAYFNSDRIEPSGAGVSLGSLSWLTGTNSGTGFATTRAVTSFSQIQLENGASRLYLGVHFGYDNYQGQLLGLAVADTILTRSQDPAAENLRIKDSPASFRNLTRTLLDRPDLYGFFGKDTGAIGFAGH